MYVVIFRATTNVLDEDYFKTATLMRDLAINTYGCIEFSAVSEGKQEIALSYWKNLKDIQKWKQDGHHLMAQKYGQQKWYQSYRVEICAIEKSYDFSK